MYSEKFDIVQETLSKSNEMFTTFRDEMDKASLVFIIRYVHI